ncbi:uncharacterized protein LOC109903213 isoform X1 [Oncorhynchus kisutch]|uniref:uncharacterized protein LOC109903213 isoform X1 n=1 Tax=Oncorhynchus kisutch TaxID=8019 RepID=UPI00099FC52E|nr:uncharacterized protein LOC109903213 isoform X1 [Oncorhynchus kisutch]
MGSTGSRSRLSQVAPCHSQPEGDLDQQASHPTSQWTISAVPTPLEPQHGPLGHSRTIMLPPLKLENSASFPPLSTESSYVASSLPQSQSNIWGPSIIHSHPPRRLQALQPLAPLSAGLKVTANHMAMGRDRRDGGVLHFSTPSQGAHDGTGRHPQVQIENGGLLEAQMVLSQQAQRRRRAHQRRVREQRVHERTIYIDNVEAPSSRGIQRLHLLNRPTQRDIFWDEMTGESLDLQEILQTSPLPLEQGERQQSQPRPPQCLCRDEELINRDLAWGGLRSPHRKTNTLTDRVEGETDGGLTMRKTLPSMLDWKTEKQRDTIPKHLSSFGDSERARVGGLRGWQREGIRGLYHGERGIWEPDLE